MKQRTVDIIVITIIFLLLISFIGSFFHFIVFEKKYDMFNPSLSREWCEKNNMNFKHHELHTLTCINKEGLILNFEKDNTIREKGEIRK